MECIICTNTLDSDHHIACFGACDHSNICSICFLRIRAIQRNFNCPTCKAPLEHVICCSKEGAKFNDFTIWGDNVGENYLLDQKSQMFFPKEYFKSKIEALWLCKCGVCRQTRRDLKQLRGHYIGEHNLHMCMLCINNKQVFPAEQNVYTQTQYEKHLRQGDGDGSQGHPSCEFCRERFYDSSDLFIHLSKEHYTCHICEKQGIRFKYFNKYENLETHFRSNHFICEERSCLEKKFVVFSNEIELASHYIQWHPQLQVKRTIPMHFKIKSHETEEINSETAAAGDNTTGKEGGKTSHFEGGLGGRVFEGEWQVEIEPSMISGDPRDPQRNLGSSSVASYTDLTASAADEAFPALPSAAPMQLLAGNAPGLVNNRWMSVADGSRKGKKEDFPQLQSKKKAGAGVAVTKPSTSSSAASAAKKTGYNVMSALNSEYPGLSSSTSSAGGDPTVKPAPAQHAFGDWAKVKTVTKKPASSSGGSKKMPASFHATADEEYELARALSESMLSYNAEGGGSGSRRNDSKIQIADAEEFEAVPVRAKNTAPAPALDSEEAYPVLDTPAAAPQSEIKRSAAGGSNKARKAAAAGGWGSALKEVGLASKTKKVSGLTVVNTGASVKTLSSKPSAAGSAALNAFAPPPGMKAIGKLTNDSKVYGAWANQVGGSRNHAEQVEVEQVAAQESEDLSPPRQQQYGYAATDFPTLPVSDKQPPHPPPKAVKKKAVAAAKK